MQANDPMKEVFKKIRRYEIKIRKEIKNRMHGDYHSVFKGSGLEFADVRDYQYGDDVRAIDWNVSAKGHGTFVKTFREEKEQNVFFILDVSGSQDIGNLNYKKLDAGREICAVLALSAAREHGNVGIIGFSDRKELYIPAGKGLKHAYYVILKLFKLQVKSVKTDLNACLSFSLNILKRKSVVILISDFIDEHYEHNLTALARKHDLVIIHLAHPVEYRFPRLGIIPVYDKETRRTRWINTSSRNFRQQFQGGFEKRKQQLETFCLKNDANYLWIDVQEDYVPLLVKLFKRRKR
jgi:uncharacterized protein (DUF58 family)